MKRFLTLCLMIFGVCWSLSSCGCDDGKDVDLVFVNDSDTVIVTVAADFQDRNEGTQNADSSPLRRGGELRLRDGRVPGDGVCVR